MNVLERFLPEGPPTHWTRRPMGIVWLYHYFRLWLGIGAVYLVLNHLSLKRYINPSLNVCAFILLCWMIWLWIRPLVSCIFYSLVRRRLVRGYLAFVSWRYHSTYGIAFGALGYYFVKSQPVVTGFVVSNHWDTQQAYFAAALVGAVVSLLLRWALFAGTGEFSDQNC